MPLWRPPPVAWWVARGVGNGIALTGEGFASRWLESAVTRCEAEELRTRRSRDRKRTLPPPQSNAVTAPRVAEDAPGACKQAGGAADDDGPPERAVSQQRAANP